MLDQLPPATGLLLERERLVHMAGMRFGLEVGQFVAVAD